MPTLFNKECKCSSKLTMMAESRDYQPDGGIAMEGELQLLKYYLITSIYFAMLHAVTVNELVSLGNTLAKILQ